jgi:hypothetical protein
MRTAIKILAGVIMTALYIVLVVNTYEFLKVLKAEETGLIIVFSIIAGALYWTTKMVGSMIIKWFVETKHVYWFSFACHDINKPDVVISGNAEIGYKKPITAWEDILEAMEQIKSPGGKEKITVLDYKCLRVENTWKWRKKE